MGPGRCRDDRLLERLAARATSRRRERRCAAIGRRLSGIVLGTRADRDRLPGPGAARPARAGGTIGPGRGYLRFRVDRPVVVDVAAPDRFGPVLAGGPGLRARPGSRSRIPTRGGRSTAGPSIADRSAWASTASIARRWPTTSSSSGPASTSRRRADRGAAGRDAGGRQRDAWRSRGRIPRRQRRVRRLQAVRRASPTSWRGRSCSSHLTPTAIRPCWPTGRVWKTHVVSGPQPDQVAISFGADPGRELVWTWRTSPEVGDVGRPDRPGRRRTATSGLAPMTSASCRATRIASRSRTCSMIRSSGATGSPWAASSRTRSTVTPWAMGRPMGGDRGRP